jgi:hypothetical protein
VSLTLLGGLGSFAFAVVTFVVAILTLRGKRKDKEAAEAREAAELGIVMLRWSHRVRRLAATNGWDQDPAWPDLPEEATPEYLRGKASAGDNEELSRLVEIAQKLTKGDAK